MGESTSTPQRVAALVRERTGLYVYSVGASRVQAGPGQEYLTVWTAWTERGTFYLIDGPEPVVGLPDAFRRRPALSGRAGGQRPSPARRAARADRLTLVASGQGVIRFHLVGGAVAAILEKGGLAARCVCAPRGQIARRPLAGLESRANGSARPHQRERPVLGWTGRHRRQRRTRRGLGAAGPARWPPDPHHLAVHAR